MADLSGRRSCGPCSARLAHRVAQSKRGVAEQERARIHAREQRAGADVDRKNERIAAKKQANAARALEKEQNAARRAAARQAEAETAARAFEHYLHVRAKVERHAPGPWRPPIPR